MNNDLVYEMLDQIRLHPEEHVRIRTYFKGTEVERLLINHNRMVDTQLMPRLIRNYNDFGKGY